MANTWHYSKDNQQLGPVSEDELRKMAADGRLARADFVSSDGMKTWEPAGEVIAEAFTGASSGEASESASLPSVALTPGSNLPERVTFGPRLGAGIVDAGVGLLIIAIFTNLSTWDASTGERAAWLGVAVYFLVEVLTGASVGKHVLGYRVATTRATVPSAATMLLRYALKYGWLLLAAAGMYACHEGTFVFASVWCDIIGIGSFASIAESRQALHDRIAKTAVYRKAAVM